MAHTWFKNRFTTLGSLLAFTSERELASGTDYGYWSVTLTISFFWDNSITNVNKSNISLVSFALKDLKFLLLLSSTYHKTTGSSTSRLKIFTKEVMTYQPISDAIAAIILLVLVIR